MKTLLVAAIGILPGLIVGAYAIYKISNIVNLYVERIGAAGL